MKKIISIFAILLLVFTLWSSISTAESPLIVTNVYWFGSNSTVLPVPGMVNAPLYVEIKNEGQTIYNFTAFIYAKPPFSYGYVINNSQVQEKTVIRLPQFNSNSTITIFQLLNISPEAKNGIYVMDLFAYGSSTFGGTVQNLSTTFYVPLEGNIHLFVAGSYIGVNNNYINPLPNQNPVPFTIIVGNSGNSPVTNISFSFTPKYPFQGNTVKELVTGIPAYGYTQVTFMVNLLPNLKNGVYPEELNYSYLTVNGNISFNFTWSNFYNITVVDAYIVSPGFQAAANMKNIPLIVEVMNIGTSYVSNLSVNYMPQYPFYGNAQTDNISIIGPMQKIPLDFIVSIYNNTTVGTYKQQIKFTIENSTEIQNFQVSLTGYTNISVLSSYLVMQTFVPSPGTHDVSLNIITANEGNTDATNVTFIYQPTYPFYGYLQKLEVPVLPPFTPVTLNFVVNIFNNSTDGIYIQKINYILNGKMQNSIFYVGIYGYSNLQVQGYIKNPPYVFTNQTFNSITFSIINSGNSLAYNVSLSVNSTMEIINTPFTISILPPHLIFNYTVYYNSPSLPGIYYITLKIGETTFSVPITVLKEPYIQVRSSIPVLSPGESKVQVTFYLKNKGPGNIQMMQIHFLYPQVIDLHVSSSNPLEGLMLNNVTLESLNENESYTVPYIIDVADNAVPGQYNAKLVMLIFENISTKPLIETYTFNFNISTPLFSTGSNALISLSNLTIFILVIIIIALVFIMLRGRKK
ncbi:MAG: hypothetical protein QXW71_03450 [Thermoplasmata archaeon]